jgi:addiction module HigA family antidote
VGARGPNCTPGDWLCSRYQDFPFREQVTILAGQSYSYSGQRTFLEAGNYFAQISYESPAGAWYFPGIGITQYRLAQDIGVHPRRINEIVHGKRAIGADTALRLSRYFGLSERYWLNLQTRYDLEIEKDRLEGRLEQEVRVFSGVTQSPAPA